MTAAILSSPLLFMRHESALPEGYRVQQHVEALTYRGLNWERVETVALVPRKDLPELEERWKSQRYRAVSDTTWARRGSFGYEPAIFLMPVLAFPNAGKLKDSEYLTVRTLEVRPAKLTDELKFWFFR